MQNFASSLKDTTSANVLISEFSSLRVLCVEDHQDTCELLTYLMSQRGWEVRSVGNLAQAQALLREERFDLLVTDLLLPDGNGATLCRHAREHNPALKTLLTSIATIDPQDLRILGADCYLPKPVEAAQLMIAVDKLCTQQSKPDSL